MTRPTSPCRCGHPADTHEHYRPGTDCGACGRAVCPAYAPHDFTPAQQTALAALAAFAVPVPMTGEEAMPDTQDDLTATDHLVTNTEKDAPDHPDADLPQPSQDPDDVPPSVVDENGNPA